MNPLLTEFLGSVLRHVLGALAVWFVQTGILTPEQADRMMIGAIAAILAVLPALAWSLWQKYRSRQKLVTALATRQAISEAEVKEMIADPKVQTPPTTTPEAAIPRPPSTHL